MTDTRSLAEEPCGDAPAPLPAPAESGEGAKTHTTAAHIANQAADLEHHAPPTLQDSPLLPPPPTNPPASAGSKTITFSSDDDGKSSGLRSLGARENLAPVLVLRWSVWIQVSPLSITRTHALFRPHSLHKHSHTAQTSAHKCL